MQSTRVIVVNAVYSNPKPVTKRILRELRDRYTLQHDRVVWLVVESKRGRVRRWLGRGWRARQGWRVSGRSNNAVAWDRDMGPREYGTRWDILTWSLGHALLPRWMNTVATGVDTWTVLHHVPERDSALVPASMERLTDLHAELVGERKSPTYGGDENQAPMKQWAAAHGLNYREAGVMFIATAKRVDRFEAVSVAGLDHKVLVVDLVG